MALTPVEVPRFGGLDLTTDPQDIGLGGAVDMLDVDLNVLGTVRSRNGFTKFSAAATANRLWRLMPVGSRLFARETTSGKTYAYNYADGTSVVSTALSGGGPLNWVGFGSGTTAYTYGGVGPGITEIARWDGAAFTYPVTGYSGVYVTVQPYDNRLVLVAANDGPSLTRVRFSDAGLPETFTANNYVDLTPNDGDTIRGVAIYNNQLFVFKTSKFFVFTGNSVDGSGNPVFNYRVVDTGTGMVYQQACSVSPHGIYFVGRDGIYVTTGGPPVKVSKALDPIFRGPVPATYTGSSTAWGAAANSVNIPDICWVNDRLYVTMTTGAATSQNRLFVLDPDLGWLVWSIGASGLARFTAPSGSTNFETLYFTYSSGTNDIGLLSMAATTDDGAAISARYRTGFWNPGKPGTEADIFEWELDGYGAVTVKTAVNDATTLGTGAAVTLGTSPAIAQGRDMRAVWGRNVSLELSGTAPWSVSRVIANVRGQTWPGYKAA